VVATVDIRLSASQADAINVVSSAN